MQTYDNVLPIWQTQPPLSPLKLCRHWLAMTFASIVPSASLEGSLSTSGAKSLTSARSVWSFSLRSHGQQRRVLRQDGKHPKGAQWISVSHKQVPSAARSRVTSKYGMENIPPVPPSASLTFLHVLVRRGAQAARGPRAHLRTCDAACD